MTIDIYVLLEEVGRGHLSVLPPPPVLPAVNIHAQLHDLRISLCRRPPLTREIADVAARYGASITLPEGELNSSDPLHGHVLKVSIDDPTAEPDVLAEFGRIKGVKGTFAHRRGFDFGTFDVK